MALWERNNWDDVTGCWHSAKWVYISEPNVSCLLNAYGRRRCRSAGTFTAMIWSVLPITLLPPRESS